MIRDEKVEIKYTKCMETATFAGGCFWCTEAIFKRLRGVISVMPGYAGGNRANPNYEQVHSGATGHAESIQLQFDPKQISYQQLVEVFFATHNPTTFNRQDYDEGTEYRSIIFYHDEKQKQTAMNIKEKLEKEKVYQDPLVTEIIPYTVFYEAEPEHKDYYDKNRSAPYCRLITDPKIKILFKNFSDMLKEEYQQ